MDAGEPMTTPAIELEGLSKAFGTKPVLDGIDLVVAPGQVFGYVGPNGAGKSTTVKILVGMLTGFEGRATVAGFDVKRRPLEVKRRIGFLPENAKLFDALTVREHLLLVGRLQGLDDARILGRAKVLLEGFELDTRIGSRLDALSKGMRQKVMIVGSLLHDPELLFLDEPLSGLDVHSTVLLKELIQALAAAGKTIFYCSHMMDVVERVCDRIAVLADGKIVAEGSFEELAAARGEGETLERIFLELTAGGGEAERARHMLSAFRDGGAVEIGE